MQKSKLAIATSTVIGLSGVAYQSALADTANTSMSAEIMQALVVTANSPLNFGTLAVTGSAAGSAVMDANGSVTGDGTTVVTTTGATTAASFTINSGGDNGTVDVTVDAGNLTHSTAASLTWSTLSAQHNLGGGATPATTSTAGNRIEINSASMSVTAADLTAYGTLSVPGTATSGSYSGTITVTANRT